MCKWRGASAMKFTDTHAKFCDVVQNYHQKVGKKRGSFIDNSL